MKKPGKRQRHPALFLCHVTRRDIQLRRRPPSINVWVATEAEQMEQDVKKPGGGFALPGLQIARTRRPGKRQRHPALFLCHVTRRDIQLRRRPPSINVWVATEAEQMEQDVKKPGGGFALPGLQIARTRRPGKRQRHPALF